MSSRIGHRGGVRVSQFRTMGLCPLCGQEYYRYVEGQRTRQNHRVHIFTHGPWTDEATVTRGGLGTHGGAGGGVAQAAPATVRPDICICIER